MTNSDVLPNSSYLQYTSYGSTADLPRDGKTPDEVAFPINVGLVLQRAEQPTFLTDNWAARQATIGQLKDNGTLWQHYGASSSDYTAVTDYLKRNSFTILGQDNNGPGYVTSQDSRTVWVQITSAAQWQQLFGTELLSGTTPGGDHTLFWRGSLALPADLAPVQGLFFDSGKFGSILPDPGSGIAASLEQGPQSLGNSAGAAHVTPDPQQVAKDYDFPLLGTDVTTDPVGFIEPGLGDAMPSRSASLQKLLGDYRGKVGLSRDVSVIGVQKGGTSGDTSGERSLDVSIVTAIDPTSTLVLYAGSGASASTMTAYDSAIWDTKNGPGVVSSSFGAGFRPAAGSPFAWAVHQLFVDAALRNMTMVTANGDGGSGVEFANGIVNGGNPASSPFEIMVGGTSLALENVAAQDPTLFAIVKDALAGDPGTIWQLVQGGMTSFPGVDRDTWLVETVWNQYVLDGSEFKVDKGFLSNNASSGGVDPTQPVPSYQSAFGLNPTSAGPQPVVGRGTPDVSALSGGDMFYNVADADMTGLSGGGGTSASTPFWASLITQINAVFADQKLPRLGYMTDLLYIAASIAPASFNDVTLGNNVSSFFLGGPITDQETNSNGDVAKTAITPTGHGYYAGPGYDLTTGLGSPDGLLLARTLDAVAHVQTYFANQPNIVNSDNQGGWTSGANQSLLLQTMTATAGTVSITEGTSSVDLSTSASASYAWTSRLAEQSLQPDFDPRLALLFDKNAQGNLAQGQISSGRGLSVSLDGS
jgi:hypothetical protein